MEEQVRGILKIAKSLVAGRAGKMTDEDYKILSSHLDKYINQFGKEKLLEYKEQLRNSPKVKDVEMRFRWDILWASKLKIGDGKGMSGDVNLYAYLNDNQIDTALKYYMKSKGLA